MSGFYKSCVATRHRSHGDTYELWPRNNAAEGNLANLLFPVDLDTTPSGIGGGTSYGPRPLYPHMHLLPSYETLVVSTKCAPSPARSCLSGQLGSRLLCQTPVLPKRVDGCVRRPVESVTGTEAVPTLPIDFFRCCKCSKLWVSCQLPLPGATVRHIALDLNMSSCECVC